MSRAEKLREFFPKVYRNYGPLNARQYAYRAEAKKIIPKSRSAFNQANSILVELREEQILPWSAVLDSSRKFDPWQTKGFENPNDYLKMIAKKFFDSARGASLPKWHKQPTIPIIMTEKEGLVPYFEHILQDWKVSVYPIRGQAGKSHLHEKFAPWIARLMANRKKIKIIYLGDCDDEGFQIPLTLAKTLENWLGSSRYNQKDLFPRLENKVFNKNSQLIFERLALKPEQVINEGLPRNSVNPKSKISKKFVDFKSELEALDPDLLRNLVREAIKQCFNSRIERKRKKLEVKLQSKIEKEVDELTKNWSEDLKE